MLVENVDNENPHEHWKHISCDGKVSVDFGCGRWEHVEHRDQSWPTTPEFLLERGASKVYAFDVDQNEINWYNSNVTPLKPQIIPLLKDLSSTENIREIYRELQPQVVKCDIEGHELRLLELNDEEFCTPDHYAIETHSDGLYGAFVERFQKLDYEITAVIHLTHANPMKVIFATKQERK